MASAASQGGGGERSDLPKPHDIDDPVALAKVSVHVRVRGDVAETEVEHVFHSSALGGRPREGTFRFPVPDGALLTGMAMEIDGRLVEGEIVERDKARRVYNEVVDTMQDPALLEWEQGNWFKLRVFPIVPEADKRVVIRYATPLVHRPTGWTYEYAIGATPIAELAIDVDGTEVAHEKALTAGLDLAVPIAAERVPVVMAETRKDATYTAARIVPDPAWFDAAPTSARKLAVIFDTSRSSLESRAQEDTVLKSTLAALGDDDGAVVIASDVDATPLATAFEHDPAAELTRLAAIEPDGASDVGAALRAAAALHPTEVVYIGDGVPTWGEQRPAELGTLADAIGAPVHAALIGHGATTELWGELAGRTGGRAMIVKAREDESRFALGLRGGGARLAGVRLAVDGAADGTSLFPATAQTLYAGDELLATIRTPAGKPAPATLTLTAMASGKPVTRKLVLATAVAEPGVARRWGAQQIAAMEASDAPRDGIVQLSTDLGVLSRYTSLLVLENDEAYERFKIERTQEQLAQAGPGTPAITGGDLDTLGASRPSLSPDEVQPGDPEIKIPAPRDAHAVTVTFPFGDTKRAVWDDAVGAWMVRFLIDKDTPDGEYQARVTIELADGGVQVLSLPYSVDTRAPAVELHARRVADGYEITARQTDSYKDADRVEVALPDGTTLELVADKQHRGRFTAVWQTAPLTAPVTLRVVARDRALNEAVGELVVR